MKTGYARVSTEEQNPDLQLAALKKVGCKRIFIGIVRERDRASSPIHYTDLDSEGGSLHLKGAIKRHTVKNDGDGGDELGGGGTGGSGFG